MEYAIEVNGLTKHYPEFSLDHISFQIPKGSIVGFIGENGAGKSTTIKAILKQQICMEKNIPAATAYENKVIVLQTLNNAFGYGTDLEFAKELFNIPLPDRYQWLEDKVDESLRVANASFENYNDVMQFLENLKGGKYGTIK